jgi:hypothetical protein
LSAFPFSLPDRRLPIAPGVVTFYSHSGQRNSGSLVTGNKMANSDASTRQSPKSGPSRAEILAMYPKGIRSENILFQIIRTVAVFVLILVYTPILWILVCFFPPIAKA